MAGTPLRSAAAQSARVEQVGAARGLPIALGSTCWLKAPAWSESTTVPRTRSAPGGFFRRVAWVEPGTYTAVLRAGGRESRTTVTVVRAVAP